MVTPNTLTGIAPGIHTITVQHPGYMNAKKEVSVTSGMTSSVYFTLVPLNIAAENGNLMVVSEPPGAAIWINGEDTQQVTPFSFEMVSGSYEVVVKKACYATPLAQLVTVSSAAPVTMVEFIFESDGSCIPAPEFPSPVVPTLILVGCIGITLFLARLPE